MVTTPIPLRVHVTPRLRTLLNIALLTSYLNEYINTINAKALSMNVLSIIIPARNESENITTTVTNLTRTLDSHSIRYEILIIDDGSSDNTYILSTSLCANLGPHIRVFRNVGLNGFGRAICHGLSNITGDYVIVYMADASDSPDDVIRYYNLLHG